MNGSDLSTLCLVSHKRRGKESPVMFYASLTVVWKPLYHNLNPNVCATQ
jgi:hypothetical protein